jgi:amidase
MPAPMDQQFAEDFLLYWGLLGFLTSRIPAAALPGLDRTRLDGFTVGLARYYGTRRRETVAALRRLRASQHVYAKALRGYDAVLTPVLGHTTPPIGHLAPTVPFDELLGRLIAYDSFCPLNNATGSPAISLPLGATSAGLPLGVHLMGPHGGERTLLELAYELEAAQPFRRLS